MENVIRFPGITRLEIDPDQVLQEAIGKLDCVVITGTTHDGEEFFASSTPDGGNALWMLMRAQKALLDVPDRAP